jgi:hypothetical protein
VNASRMAPHYCPYCADQDLRPHDPADGPSDDTPRGAWECRGCLRAFSVAFVGVAGVPS